MDLYALTNPQHALGVPSAVLYNDVPCRWWYESVCPESHHRCLRGIEPPAIVDAVLAFLHDPDRGATTSPFGARSRPAAPGLSEPRPRR